MYNIAITTDVEVLSPSLDGSVEINIDSQITTPLNQLLRTADLFGIKITLFLEIFQFFRFLELKENQLTMKKLIKAIEAALSNGHEIQLHTHSEWITAEYRDERWYRTFSRPDSVHEIFDLFITELPIKLQNLREIFPKIRLNCYRAGAYRVNPKEILFKELRKNGLELDSSLHENSLSSLSEIHGLIEAPILGKFPTFEERWDMNLSRNSIFYFFDNRSLFDPNIHANFNHYAVMTGHTKMNHRWELINHLFRMLQDDDLVKNVLLSQFVDLHESERT